MLHNMRIGIAFTLSLVVAFSGMVLLNDWTLQEGAAQNIFHRGHTDEDVIWSADNDHYVDDEFNISYGHTLTIGPGTRVFIDGSHGEGRIVVLGGGKLVIAGLDENPVIITSNSTYPMAGDYSGIVVLNDGRAYINYTFIRFAKIGIDAQSLTEATSKLEIRNCMINDTEDWGINVTGEKENLILNCTINDTGIEGNDNSGGIRLNSASVIVGCKIFNTSGTGIRIDKGSPRISNTDIYNTSGHGIWIGSTSSKPEITETNITYATGNGILIEDLAVPSIIGCNISNTWDSNINISGSTRNINIVNSTIGNWTNPGQGHTLNIGGTDNTHRIHVTFLNTIYRNNTFNVADYGNLSVKWYVNVHVNDSVDSPIEGANITLLNPVSIIMDQGITGPDGMIRYLKGVEFIYNSLGHNYDKYYWINITCPGYQDTQEKIWIDQFNQTSFTLTDTHKPIANAGQDRTVDQHDNVTLNGSLSSDNVEIMNYTWTFEDNGSQTLNGINPWYVFDNAGIFNIKLNVTDQADNGHSDNVTLTVKDTTDPVADAGLDQTVNQTDQVTFNGRSSIDNVGIINFTWNFNDNGARTLYGEGPKYTFNNSGTFEITLVVKDTEGNTHTDTVAITVNDTTKPVANAGPEQMVNQTDIATFDGSGSSDNVAVTNYTWKFIDIGSHTLYGVGPNYTFNNAGQFVITLNVTDWAGNSNTSTVTIKVNDTTKPIANAGSDIAVDQGEPFTFDGSGSTDNVAIISYNWTFMDTSMQTLKGVRPNYTFNKPGSFNVTLNITDKRGNWALDNMTVTVNDIIKPVADAGPDQLVDLRALFTFDGSGSSDNVGIINYTWNFKYNNSFISLYGENVKFTFLYSGIYNITLRVKDAFNNSDSTDFTVTVSSVDKNVEPNDTGVNEEDGSGIWLWVIIVGLGGIIFGGLYFYIDRRKKIIEGRIKDENEIKKITAGRMDFIILRKPGTKRYKKYELHRIQGVAGDVAGIFWDTARDSSWVVDRMITESREKVTSMFEFDIKKNLEKGYTLDYFGSGLIIRSLGKRFR